LTGYGVVDLLPNGVYKLIAHGTLKLSNTGGRAVIPLEQRLLLIHEGLSKIILEYRPHSMSIERVFFAKNAVSALKLGQARGAAILCGAIHRLDIVEYSPSEVKASLTGHGQASKDQVAKMLQILLKTQAQFDTSDASDGVALAMCHAQWLSGQGGPLSAQQQSESRGSLSVSRGKRRNMSLAEAVGAYERLGIRREKPGR
jgi:crossover junction endodeoxyribonuclease RuvC